MNIDLGPLLWALAIGGFVIGLFVMGTIWLAAS